MVITMLIMKEIVMNYYEQKVVELQKIVKKLEKDREKLIEQIILFKPIENKLPTRAKITKRKNSKEIKNIDTRLQPDPAIDFGLGR